MENVRAAARGLSRSMGDNPPMHRTDTATRAPALLTVLIALCLVVACGGSTNPSATAGTSTPGAGSTVPGVTSTPAGPSSGVPSVPVGSGSGQPVEFETGVASLKLTGSETATVALKEIAPQEDAFSGFDPVEGTSVIWREAREGWYLSLTGFYGTGDVKTGDTTPFLVITSPDGKQVQDNAGACTIHVRASSAEGFEGSIDCAGLAWEDENGDPSGKPFGASATFKAAP